MSADFGADGSIAREDGGVRESGARCGALPVGWGKGGRLFRLRKGVDFRKKRV